MKISIITPTYNSETVIETTLKSIENQTFKNIECIIIDGKSQDTTIEIIKKFTNKLNLIIISEEDHGTYDAMNKGLQLATGDVFAILNAGDYYPNENIVSTVLAEFKTNKKTQAVYGDLEYVNKNHSVIRYWKSGGFSIKKIYRGWIPPHPSFFVRKKIYDQYGYFNVKLEISADYELMLRFLLKHRIPVTYIPKVMVKMPTGGKSNESIQNRIQAHQEDRLAWKMNNLKPKFFTVTLKPLSKILQYFRKDENNG